VHTRQFELQSIPDTAILLFLCTVWHYIMFRVAVNWNTVSFDFSKLVEFTYNDKKMSIT